MASTYTDIGTELMTTGENAGNWGTKTNTNIQIIEEAIRGYVAVSIAGSADTTALTYTDGSTGDSARNAVIALTGTITGNQVVTVTAKEKVWIIDNQTSGAYTVQVLVSGQTGVTWATTDKGTKILYCNGTDVIDTGIASNKFAPDSADGEALGSSSKEFSDLYLADSGVIYFGNDQDTTLTHTDGTGLTLNSTNKLLFRDSALYINSSTDGQLDLVADTEIQIAATTIDINGAVALNGAITGATNVTLSGELDAATLDISGNADIDGTTNLDIVDIDGAVQLDATLTVGADDQGYDVKFFGDTASAYMLWDTSTDDLVLAGAAGIDLAGDIDVDGTANLDAVDIDGAVQIDGAVTVGVDGTGLDVKFFGDTSGSFLLWDQSADALLLTDSTPIQIGDAQDLTLYHDGTNSYITNAVGALKVATETSGIAITLGHTTSEVTVADNLTVTGTLTLGSGAELTEAELEFLDGITAGTAAASKAMVLDSNADITGGRNLTISGELDAATGDFSGDVDVDGTLEADAITINGTAIGSVYGVVAGSSSIVTTGALDSGSITSGFGAIDNGTSNIRSATITAETAFVPDASGGADLGTTALEFNDLFLNDSGSIQFGDDQDTTLVHTDGTGLTLNSTNKLCFNDASQFVQGSSATVLSIGATDEIDLTATAVDLNGTLDVSGNAQFSGTVTVGVDDTGLDVKFFGASAGAYMEWDESADQLRIMGASADATTSTGKLLLATSLTDVNANDVIGKIEFQAPHEAGGTDAITVAASIQALAQATFSSSVNATDLIFYTGHSEANTEKFRFTSQGELGVGGANYGTDGQVLTSTGAGTAPAWEDASGGSVTAINNATNNELVTIGSTTSELDAEANLTFTGSALTCIGTITTGIDDTGHDVKFFGATSGSFLLWDESDDALELTDSSPIKIGDGGDMTVYHDGSHSYITNATGALKLATETSGIAVTIGHTTSETTVADNLTITGTTVGTSFDLNGTADGLILDANGNTTISSPTDDQIDFEIAGADDFTMTANTFTILSGSTIAIAAGGAITNAGSMAPDITSTGKAAVFGF